MMNNRLKMTLATFALMVSGSLYAGQGDLAQGPSYYAQRFGVSVVEGDKSSVTYDLVNLDYNRDLTPALRTELQQAKAKYPQAARMTHEFYKGKLVGTAYNDLQGKVINYSLTY